jgi:hypothetical protein
MNVLILAAGDTRKDGSGQDIPPTWLSEIEGQLILEHQVKSFGALCPSRYIFMFRRSDVEKYYLNDIVEQIAPGSTIIEIGRETSGAACTALLASGAVAMDEDLVVASATDQIHVDYEPILKNFRGRGADAGVLSFPALHPRYSYVAINEDDWVIESSEKRPISRNASTGLYWFSKARYFFSGAKEMILKDAHVQGRFYICPVLNELILDQKRIAVHRLNLDQYHPLKSDKQVDQLERDLEGAS